MRKFLLYITIFLLSLCFQACKDGENNDALGGDPIAFKASVEPFRVVYGTAPADFQLMKGDSVGIYVNATNQIKYLVSASGASSDLETAYPLTTEYGSQSYACVPYNGMAGAFPSMVINIPSSQIFKNGHNPNLINSVAYSEVKDASAEFDFKNYGAAFAIGLSSNDAVTISKMTITAEDPANGNYMSGQKRLTFNENRVDYSVSSKVANGGNSIELSFPDNLTLGASTQYVTFSTLPFATMSGGLKIVLYDVMNHTCSVPAIFADDTELGDGGAIAVSAGDLVVYNLGEIDEDDFDIPAQVKFTFVDDASGSPFTDGEACLYSENVTGEELLETFNPDSKGEYEKELNPGNYKVAVKYPGQFGDKWNSVVFSVKKGEEKTVRVSVIPIIFADDFTWITSEMGGSNKVLKTYYQSLNPPAVASAANDEVMIKEALSSARTQFSAIGWGTNDDSGTYLRPGCIKFGRKNTIGSITTPALGKYYSDVPANVTLHVNAISWNNVKDGAWTYEKAQISITIEGQGSFSETTAVTTFLSNLLNQGTPPDYYTSFGIPVYGVTAETNFTISSVKQTSGTQWRCMIDDVMVN
jgi:hypothetical protein